jgi:hypothetical protein
MHNTLRPSRNQSLRVTLSDPGNRCTCAGCHLPRLKRFETFNAQLAQENDRLRRENEQLRKAVAG